MGSRIQQVKEDLESEKISINLVIANHLAFLDLLDKMREKRKQKP